MKDYSERDSDFYIQVFFTLICAFPPERIMAKSHYNSLKQLNCFRLDFKIYLFSSFKRIS